MKRIAIPVLIVLFFSLSTSFVSACSCARPTSFCPAVEANPDILIVKAKRTSHVNGMAEMEVLEVLSGIEAKKNINVWGSSMSMCGTDLENLSTDKTWVLLLTKLDSSIGYPDEVKEGDYYLSLCYTFDLEEVESAMLKELKSCANSSIQSCYEDNEIQAQPNPSANEIAVNIPLCLHPWLSGIVLYNNLGQKLREYNYPSSEEVPAILEVDLAYLSSGVYYLSFYSTKSSPMTKRIVVHKN